MTARIVAAIVVLLAGIAVMTLSGLITERSETPTENPQPSNVPAANQSVDALPDDPAPSPPPAAAPVEYRGLAIQIHTNYRAIETFTPLINEIAETGANMLLIATAGWMEHADSQGIYIEHRKTPSRDDMLTLIRTAREAGLDVFVMPIVLLAHPRGREWRGVIEPPSWELWWREYRDFIVYFADLAREGQARGLILGSELVKTETQTAEWVATIELVRARFPEGMLGYSANWDTYETVQFWDKLDFVGMTSYFKLADHENPTVAELVENWRPIHQEVGAWIQRIDRPLVLTEVGWCSQEGAAITPWNYFRNQKATPAGHAEQRNLYEAFLEVWDATPGLVGVIWWEWKPGEGGPGDFGYTPKDKPAEDVLRRWFAGARVAGDD